MMDSTAPSNQFFASPRDKKYIGELEKFLNNGTRVSLADVTYSNGADNGFMNEFANRGNLEKLTAYNGWNTADNTIGFAIAQGILAPQISAEDNALLMRLRLVDDWFYQSNARRDATDFLERSGSSEEVTSSAVPKSMFLRWRRMSAMSLHANTPLPKILNLK